MGLSYTLGDISKNVSGRPESNSKSWNRLLLAKGRCHGFVYNQGDQMSL
jgi:hypothetical protein